MARNEKATLKMDVANMTVTLIPTNGQSRVYDAGALSGEIKDLLLLHGLNQKIRDGYAKPEADPVEVADRIWEGLLQGHWRVTGGERAESVTYFVRAFAEYKNRDVAAVQRLVNEIEASEDEKRIANLKMVRKSAPIVKIMARMRAEDAVARAKAVESRTAGVAEVADLDL